MHKIFLNKNGQVGVTITWMVAFIVIFFIMLVFVGMVASIAAQKGVGKNKILVIENGFNKLDAQRYLIMFLNSEVEFNGQKMLFKDFISEVDDSKDKENKFKEIAKTFIDNTFSIEGNNKIYYRVWMRIYSPNDQIEQYYTISGNKNYEVSSFSRGGAGGVNCDPLEENAVVINFLISNNKKIVVCGNVI